MIAAGVRISCEASATKRRSVANAARIGTRARPVTKSVTSAAPASPTRPTSVDGEDQAARLAIVERRARTRPGASRRGLPAVADREREEADRDGAVRHGPQVPTGRPRRGDRRLVGQALARDAGRVGDQRSRRDRG